MLTKDNLIKTTIPFFVSKGSSEIPRHNGCGVLFQIGEMYYCFSNYHVLCGPFLDQTFIIVKQRKFLLLGKDVSHEGLDLAIFELGEGVVSALKAMDYCFVQLEDIGNVGELNFPMSFVMAGFPGNKTKAKMNPQKLVVSPLRLQTRNVKYDFSKYGKNPLEHIAVVYRRKQSRLLSTGEKGKRLPHPKGMSGGGLWMLQQYPDSIRVYLVGIMTEYDDKRAAVISIKIKLFLETLNHFFDVPNIIRKRTDISLISAPF